MAFPVRPQYTEHDFLEIPFGSDWTVGTFKKTMMSVSIIVTKDAFIKINKEDGKIMRLLSTIAYNFEEPIITIYVKAVSESGVLYAWGEV